MWACSRHIHAQVLALDGEGGWTLHKGARSGGDSSSSDFEDVCGEIPGMHGSACLATIALLHVGGDSSPQDDMTHSFRADVAHAAIELLICSLAASRHNLSRRHADLQLGRLTDMQKALWLSARAQRFAGVHDLWPQTHR